VRLGSSCNCLKASLFCCLCTPVPTRKKRMKMTRVSSAACVWLLKIVRIIAFHAKLFILMELLPDIQVTISHNTACAFSALVRAKGWQREIVEGWPCQRGQGNSMNDLSFHGLSAERVGFILAWAYQGRPCGPCHMPIIWPQRFFKILEALYGLPPSQR
jgi:hypothetical protein